jgi:hypothetical protein
MKKRDEALVAAMKPMIDYWRERDARISEAMLQFKMIAVVPKEDVKAIVITQEMIDESAVTFETRDLRELSKL